MESKRIDELTLLNHLAVGLPIRGDLTPWRILGADVLRSVLVRQAPSIDPRGLELRDVLIEGDLDVSHGLLPQLKFYDCLFTGFVTLDGAQVRGDLSLEGCAILGIDTRGYSLSARNTSINGALVLSDTSASSPFSCRGAVRIASAKVEGACLVRGASINGSTPSGGFGLLADLLQTGGPLYAEGLNLQGSMSLVSASIGNQINVSRATIRGVTNLGCSIQADSVSVRGAVYGLDMDLAGGISFDSASLNDLLQLQRLIIHQADLRGNSITAELASVRAAAQVRECNVTGGMSWIGAQVGMELDIQRYIVAGERTFEFGMNGLQADQLRLDDSLGRRCLLRLDGTSLRRLEVHSQSSSLPKLDQVHVWQVQSFAGPVVDTPRVMAEWLADRCRGTQPWFEVAAFLDRSGKPAEAKRLRYDTSVLATKQVRAMGRWGSWGLRLTYGATTGYGYYPLRTFGWIVALLLAATLISAGSANGFTTETTPSLRAVVSKTYGDEPVPGRLSAAQCKQGEWTVSCFDPLLYSMSLTLPALDLGQNWQPPRGWQTYALDLIRGIAWGFLALFLAGFTGLLKRGLS